MIAPYSDPSFLSIVTKFMVDRRSLPLTWHHFGTYRRIHRQYWRQFGKFPNIINCPTLNEKIQWLKLFDHYEHAPTLVNKVAVKDYVTQKVPGLRVPKTLGIYKSPDSIDWRALPERFVVKTNHDSGNVFLVKDKRTMDMVSMHAALTKALKRTFGARRGVWAYDKIKPAILIEEIIGEYPQGLADYKFYCVNGEVRFMHYIYDRSIGAKEQIIDHTGQDMKSPLHPKFPYGDKFQRPEEWLEMIALAEQASAGMRFVRVDLYLVDKVIYFGEYTFWPGSGLYHGPAIEQLGQLMDFPLSPHPVQ